MRARARGSRFGGGDHGMRRRAEQRKQCGRRCGAGNTESCCAVSAWDAVSHLVGYPCDEVLLKCTGGLDVSCRCFAAGNRMGQTNEVRMRLAGVIVVTAALAAGVLLTQARISRPTAATRSAEQAALHGSATYTLPPAKLERAMSLGTARRNLAMAGELMFPAELLLVLVTGWAARLRDVACRISRHRWVQGFGFWCCCWPRWNY